MEEEIHAPYVRSARRTVDGELGLGRNRCSHHGSSSANVQPSAGRANLGENRETRFDRQDDRLCAVEHPQKNREGVARGWSSKKRGDLGSNNYEAGVTVDKRKRNFDKFSEPCFSTHLFNITSSGILIPVYLRSFQYPLFCCIATARVFSITF